MAAPSQRTRTDRLYEVCARLLYGPGTWFQACREAAAAEPIAAADLTARLVPGHEVADALSTRSSWPGRARLPGTGASPADREPGPALSAARAAAGVVAALAEPRAAEAMLCAAASHFAQAQALPRVRVTGADISIGTADPALSAVIRRLAVLADAALPDDAAAFGLTGLLARALRAAFPPVACEVELPVLFDRRAAGGHGLLLLSWLAEGPPGLYPDPRVMLFFTADAAYSQALDAAWATAPRRLADRCIVWRLTADRQPCDEVAGGSLGGAFGVGLSELARAVPRLGWLRPRRLDRRCAVTAGLTPAGRLLEVTGQQNKLEEAVRQHWRVVLAPPARQDDPSPGKPSATLLHEARARYAADLPAAARLSRSRVSASFAATAMALILAAATVTGGVLSAIRGAHAAELRQIGNRLVFDAAQLQSSDPAGSLLLGSLAARIGTPGARAGLAQTLLTTTYAGTLPEQARLCGGAQSWSPDGSTVATAARESVTLWSAQRHTAQRALRAGSRVTGCAFAPDGGTLAIAAGGHLQLVPLGATPTRAAVTVAAAKQVAVLQFAPNGLLATGSASGTLQLWRVTPGGSAAPAAHLLSTIRQPGQGSKDEWPIPVFSADSRLLALSDRSGSRAFLVSVRDPRAPRILGSARAACSPPRGWRTSPAVTTAGWTWCSCGTSRASSRRSTIR